jgi:hypothetical protein
MQLLTIHRASTAVSLLAHDAPQFLQDQISANDALRRAARCARVRRWQRTGSQRKLRQKFPQSLDGRFDARHPRSIRIQALRLDTAAADKTLLGGR